MEHIIGEMLQNFEQGKISRRQLIQSLALAATAASAVSAAAQPVGMSPAKATYLNHVGYRVADFKKTRDWYADMFNLKTVFEDKEKANLMVGESQLIFHDITKPGQLPVDHIALTIAGWDADKTIRPAVTAEIKKRGIEIMRETECCVHIRDLNGYEVQLGGKDE